MIWLCIISEFHITSEFSARTLAGMSDDHRSSNGNPNGDENEDGDNQRKSSSLTTNQNIQLKPDLTSSSQSIYDINM